MCKAEASGFTGIAGIIPQARPARNSASLPGRISASGQPLPCAGPEPEFANTEATTPMPSAKPEPQAKGDRKA